MPLHTNVNKFHFGDVDLHDESGFEFRKRTPRLRNQSGDAFEMARFNPASLESALTAARYVGADDNEILEIKSYFESIGAQ